MITISEADAVHTARNNAAWLSLNNTQKTAALTNAGDYFLAHYAPFKPDAGEDQRYVIAYALLAFELHSNPASLKQESNIKEKGLESDGNKIKTVYQDADKTPAVDPYPLITNMIAPLRAVSSSGISYGQMRAFI